MKRVYEAFRSPDPVPTATASVFRKAPGLLVLFTRVEWDANGAPHIPGNLDVWKDALNDKSDSKLVHVWGKKAHSWNSPEQLLEAMASLSRVESDTGPLQSYLTLSEIDARRPAGQAAVSGDSATTGQPFFKVQILVHGVLRVSRAQR